MVEVMYCHTSVNTYKKGYFYNIEHISEKSYWIRFPEEVIKDHKDQDMPDYTSDPFTIKPDASNFSYKNWFYKAYLYNTENE